MKNITIIGSGSWGSALAIYLATKGKNVKIWSFAEEERDEINNEKKCRFLPNVKLPEGIYATSDYEEALEGSEIILHVTPSKFVRSTMSGYKSFVKENQMVIMCSKGFEPNSLRLPNHKKETIQKFSYILKHAQRGVTLSKKLRKKFNVKKQCFTVLSENKLSTTITTSPDDCLHYSEPRVLTVRENARIQSFPDWFEFKGKYTTGGMLRREDCPRYSQVGNAVPPLMAEIIGNFVINIIR